VGLPSKLLKVACTTGWFEDGPLSDTQLKEARDKRAVERSLGMSHEQDTPNTISRKNNPTLALKLLRWIIKMSFKTKDIPTAEKGNIVTGLPKTEGQVNSTDTLRPISVGPVIGKIINHVVATRLGKAIVAHKLMDNAQFAFLPGRSIHGAIGELLECLKKSAQAPNNT
jgi:hypothetical protein